MLTVAMEDIDISTHGSGLNQYLHMHYAIPALKVLKQIAPKLAHGAAIGTCCEDIDLIVCEMLQQLLLPVNSDRRSQMNMAKLL